MKHSLITTPVSFMLLAYVSMTYADIYSCLDDKGQTAFADSKNKIAYKNCRLIMRDDTSPVPTANGSSNTKTATPSNFPKIDSKTQRQRDDVRKKILQSELDKETKALADAQKSFDEDSKNANAMRANNIKEPAKIAQFDDNLKAKQDEIKNHQDNIRAIQKELDSTR